MVGHTDSDSGKLKYSRKQCHFVHHKSHLNWPTFETRLPLQEGTEDNRVG